MASKVSTAAAARYRVFLGNGRYFVSSDVGGGKMQWYAFHKEPAGGRPSAAAVAELLCSSLQVCEFFGSHQSTLRVHVTQLLLASHNAVFGRDWSSSRYVKPR